MREVSKNSRESKKFITTLYDFTPPHFTLSSNPLPQGEGEDSMCGALPQPPLTFLQGKKVSKKTFDLNDSRNSQESPSSMQLIVVLGGDSPLSSHISPSPKVKCAWRGQGGGVFENDSCNSTQKSRRNASAKKWEKGRSSASADFLLEAEKRGTPPKSGVACERSEAKTRQLLVRRGSGVGGVALLQEKTSEFSGKINSEFVNDSRESWGFKGATPPCAKSPSARMGLFASPSLWEGARGWVKFQNSKDSRESQEFKDISHLLNMTNKRKSQNSLDCHDLATPNLVTIKSATYHKNSASLEFSHNDNMGNCHESADSCNNTDSRESPKKNSQNNPTHKKTVFSGIQPTGDLHLGNYLGAIKTWVAHQELYENIFCIANSHAITTRQNPRYLRESTLNLACMLLSCGIDPKKSALFIQSEVDYHPALAWILDCNIFMGDMSRMTQFKDKSAKNAKNINVGLFNYPALMAADILLYGADLVPVGADQKQHIELTRNVAIKFNRDFGECFKVPEPLIVRESARIMGLDNPNIKMSKSIKSPNHAIFLLDSPEIITRKIKRAVTDSDGLIAFDESRAGLYNLLCMYEVFSKKGRDEILREFSGKGYGALKSALSEAIISEIAPVREEYLRLQKNRDFVEGILKAGREKVEPIARETYERAKKMVGLW